MTQSLALDLIDALANAETKVVEKPWGKEVWVAKPNEILIKIIFFNEGYRTSLHVHEEKQELMIPLPGDDGGSAEVNGEVRPMTQTGPIRVYPGDLHRLSGPAMLLEISTYHPDDVQRPEDDYGRES